MKVEEGVMFQEISIDTGKMNHSPSCTNYSKMQYFSVAIYQYICDIYWTCVCVCMCVLVAQTCPTLCHPTDCNPPSSSVHGILQAKYWSGLPFPSPEDLPDPGIKPGFPVLQADALPSELLGILLANSRVITA